MLNFRKSAAAVALLVLASSGVATADENVTLSLTTICDCFQLERQPSYLGDVFAAMGVEVPRSSVLGKSRQELSEGVNSSQRITLQEVAKHACALKAVRHLSVRSQGEESGLSVRVQCADEINIGVSRR